MEPQTPPQPKQYNFNGVSLWAYIEKHNGNTLKFHNEYGPAVTTIDGQYDWWIHGKQCRDAWEWSKLTFELQGNYEATPEQIERRAQHALANAMQLNAQ